jgi:hypothetical protein
MLHPATPRVNRVGAAGLCLFNASTELIRRGRTFPRRHESRSPEKDADVDLSRCRSIDDVEHTSSTIRHLERRPHKRDREPDTVLGRLDRFTNPPKRESSINERPNDIASTDSIRARSGNFL